MEEFPASKVHIQPVQPDLLGGFPADVCPHITGQFRCGRSEGGGGVGVEIPSDNLNFLFPSKIFPPGTYYFFQISQPAKSCLKNRYFEEQIHRVPLILQNLRNLKPNQHFFLLNVYLLI